MYQKLQLVFNQQLNRLYFPILLTILDTFGTASIFGSVYYVLLHLIEGQFTSGTLKTAMLILGIGYVIRLLAVGFSQYLFQIRGAKLIRDARLNISNHLKELPLGYFSKESIGTIINTCTVDMTHAERVITHLIGDMLKVIFVTGYILSASFVVEPKLALLQLILVVLSLPLIVWIGKLGEKGGHQKKVVVNDVLARVMEYIDGIRIFRSYNQTGVAFGRLNESFKRYRDESIRLEVKLVPLNFIFFIIIDFIVPIIFIAGSYMLLAGEIQVETMVIFVIISLGVSTLFRPFSVLYTEYKVLSVTIDHIVSLYKMDTASYTKETADFPHYEIEFDHVQFAYEKGQSVLQDMSFTMLQNTMTALIGPSGSGKSTILNVLARFWDIDGGTIRIGGENIQEIKPDALLEKISIMFQNVYVLNDTILQNIIIGKPNATLEEVEQACRRANCHEFIMKLEHGYETVVGEGGSTLSGGEKQRISLARAFLKDAPIILLDEATASLDPDNEMEIKESVDKLVEGKTVVVIAHKLNTIQHADQILFLENGTIRESGTHEELMALNDRYAAMYYEQLEAKGWRLQV
ncbi:ABC transporter ATP-binding protein [Bacillus norwichensis]|uniref:ABC transporter ATP-binding protein n=1 Tax=Bacillus norwichensis TaxID=2762217 RepID=A0ABR8VQ26_9BACI|nr:ABC transporter ATP-binding protein [Bacillus norwichensis]MBD8006865.1 ABC transporter ATP-binding protein [Bacillus norwichensis]